MFLRSAALRRVDVSGLCADHRVEWQSDRLETKDIRAGSRENEEDFGVFAEGGFQLRNRSGGVRVVTVRWNVTDVRGGDCLEDLGMRARPVVRRELPP